MLLSQKLCELLYGFFFLISECFVSHSWPIPPICRAAGNGKGTKYGLVERNGDYLYLSEKTERCWLYFGRHNVEQGKEINPVQCP